MRRINPFWILTLLCVLLLCPLVQAQADVPTEEAVDTSISLGKVIQWGGIIGYFVIFLSVVTVMLIVFHLIVLRKSKLFPEAARDRIVVLFRDNKIKEAVNYVRDETSLLARIIGGGLSRVRGGYAGMEEIINDVAQDEAMRLEQSVGYFSLIAAVAPLCGLLGTVVGMIVAFNQIAIHGVVTPRELADPIQKALVTTCFGLIVAIPNVIAHTFFRNHLARLLAELDMVVEELLTPFRNPTRQQVEVSTTTDTGPVHQEHDSDFYEDDDDTED